MPNRKGDIYKKSLAKTGNIRGKFVILRADFNVPIQNGKITSSYRIDVSLPTIYSLSKKGAKVIILSHLGEDGEKSLLPVLNYLRRKIGKVLFAKTLEELEEKKKEMKAGDIVLLENIRGFKGEIENELKFVKELSKQVSFYINEAFSVSHRKHASIVGLPKIIPSFFGIRMSLEIEKLEEAINMPKGSLVIFGGAKFKTKLPLINKFIKKADNLVITGALANSFFYEAGFEIGQSFFEKDSKIKPLLKNKKVLLPFDVMVTQAGGKRFCQIEEVEKGEKIVDIGKETANRIVDLIKESKFVLWNGPTGIYEEGFTLGSEKILQAISKNKTNAIIGGGDTAVLALKYKKENIFVSSGGGATLDYLSKGTLPGIDAVMKSK